MGIKELNQNATAQVHGGCFMEEAPSEGFISIREGLFVVPSSSSEKPYLTGSACRSCGEVSFPPRSRCRRCSSVDLEKVPLSRRGRLYGFTTVSIKLPDARVQFPALVGIVELPEGERMRTLLTECDPRSLEIGDEMELVIDGVYEDESGNKVVGWKFTLVREE